MSKLPPNLVKAPTFDSPLRKTTGPELAVVAAPAAEEAAPASETETPAPKATAPAPKPKVKPARKKAKAPKVADAEELYRTTLRIPQSVYLALETECHERRMAGQKIRVAELLREIASDWAKKYGRR